MTRCARRAAAQPRNEAGQSAVELALLLPVLAVLVFGIVDLGRAFYLHSALVNAVREGARFCAIWDTLPNTVEQRLDTSNRDQAVRKRINLELGEPADPSTQPLSAANLSSDLAVIYTSNAICPAGESLEPVLVVLRADFKLVTPLPFFGGSTTLPMEVSATMVRW